MTALVFLIAFLMLAIPLLWIGLWLWLSDRTDRKFLAHQRRRQGAAAAIGVGETER